MGRENKKEGVAMLHREAILAAAEKLFTEKGFAETTISDISAASDYSRRTIYAYYLSKDDILHHIIGKGLTSLRDDIKNALDESEDFLTRYRYICRALKKYYEDCPLSAKNIIKAETGKASTYDLTPAVKNLRSGRRNKQAPGSVYRGWKSRRNSSKQHKDYANRICALVIHFITAYIDQNQRQVSERLPGTFSG